MIGHSSLQSTLNQIYAHPTGYFSCSGCPFMADAELRDELPYPGTEHALFMSNIPYHIHESTIQSMLDTDKLTHVRYQSDDVTWPGAELHKRCRQVGGNCAVQMPHGIRKCRHANAAWNQHSHKSV
jgi:hypothetical protein